MAKADDPSIQIKQKNRVTMKALIHKSHYFIRIKIICSYCSLLEISESVEMRDRLTTHFVGFLASCELAVHLTGGIHQMFWIPDRCVAFNRQTARLKRVRSPLVCRMQEPVQVRSRFEAFLSDPVSVSVRAVAALSLLPWIISTVYIMPVTSVPLVTVFFDLRLLSLLHSALSSFGCDVMQKSLEKK